MLNPTGLDAHRLDLLMIAGSLGALADVAVWLFVIATRHSRNWAIVLAATVWIPYVNLIVASIYAQRYWGNAARARPAGGHGRARGREPRRRAPAPRRSGAAGLNSRPSTPKRLPRIR